jgi:HEPN domain-containing protein
LSRKTDSRVPADWLWIAESDLGMVRLAASQEVSFQGCRSKLAEILEKVLKAELIRLGWPLERTHDLNRLVDELAARKSDLLVTVTPTAQALAEVYFADRYPGFDLDDPDWPTLRANIDAVTELLDLVKARVRASKS